MTTISLSFFWWTILYTAPCIALGQWLLGYAGVFFALFLCSALIVFIEPKSITDESMYWWRRAKEDVQQEQYP
jgi:cytochrome b subunit of formate dehydrogenase